MNRRKDEQLTEQECGKVLSEREKECYRKWPESQYSCRKKLISDAICLQTEYITQLHTYLNKNIEENWKEKTELCKSKKADRKSVHSFNECDLG